MLANKFTVLCEHATRPLLVSKRFARHASTAMQRGLRSDCWITITLAVIPSLTSLCKAV